MEDTFDDLLGHGIGVMGHHLREGEELGEVADHRLQWNRQWAVNPVRYGLGNRSCPWRRGIGRPHPHRRALRVLGNLLF